VGPEARRRSRAELERRSRRAATARSTDGEFRRRVAADAERLVYVAPPFSAGPPGWPVGEPASRRQRFNQEISVAQHKSAEKRARQAERRRAHNRSITSALRTRVKAVREAIASGDKTAVAATLREAEKALRQAASKGVLKKQTASRQVSRLAKAVHKAATA
jgi:small subunit ribosomal protein S20